MVAGASENEIALVLFLATLVLLATKVGKIGEAIGGLFADRSPGSHQEGVEETVEDGEDHHEG